jgi:hypothetical protein
MFHCTVNSAEAESAWTSEFYSTWGNVRDDDDNDD